MEYLKDKTQITEEYVAKLKEHVLANQDDFFKKSNEADAWLDFNRFPTMKTDRAHLCLPTEPFLVDRSVPSPFGKGQVHTFCICTISEKGKVGMEIPVVKVEDLASGKWRNGYFLLPVL